MNNKTAIYLVNVTIIFVNYSTNGENSYIKVSIIISLMLVTLYYYLLLRLDT